MTAPQPSGSASRCARRAFTLLELIACLVIAGILLTVMVYAGAALTTNTRDALANANIGRAVAAERDVARRAGSFSAHPGDLDLVGRDLTIVSGKNSVGTSSTSSTVISLAVGTTGSLGVAVMSASGQCFGRRVTAPTSGSNETQIAIDRMSLCNGASALADGDSPLVDQTVFTPLP